MATYRAILPVTSGLTAINLVDNFDERTIINDDLNMAGYKIYNLKNPTDDQDAATKYYVDVKQYNINSANITGNFPWSRLSNVPSYFPTKTSMITSGSNLDIGNYKFMKNGNEVIGLTNNSVITNYINDNAVTDQKIQTMNYNKLTNVPTSFTSKSSTMKIDSDINMNNYKFSVPTPTDNIQAANKQYVDTTVQTTVSNFIGTPIGCIMIWSTINIPTNWLECNGRAVNQSLFPQLYAIMNIVPDLRGVFVRGFDSGKGIDSNRTLGSQQDDSFCFTYTYNESRRKS